MSMVSPSPTQTVRTLNELLRGEISAVETYGRALSLVHDDLDARQDLEECRASHQDRAARLGAEIRHRGGDPASGSGAWGLLASLIERVASIAGPRIAIAALELGEDHGLKEYEERLVGVDLPARSIISADFYPQQVRTHSIVSSLRTVMAMPPARVG